MKNKHLYDLNIALVDSIKDFTAPIYRDNLPCGDFGFVRTYRDGTFFRVGQHKKWIDLFFEEELYNCSSHKYLNPANFKAGPKYTSSFDKPKGRTEEMYCHGAGLWHQLVIHTYHEDYIESAVFCATPENVGAIDFYLNNMALLENLKSDFKPFLFNIVDVDDPKNRIQLKDSDRIQLLFKDLEGSRLRRDFMLLPNVKLSPREFECLKQLSLGKSAKEIGRFLGISHKTVEGHFENIRLKSSVSSKSQLLEAFFESDLVDIRFTE